MSQQDLRRHLTHLLDGAQAHIRFQDAVDGFPVEKAGLRPGGSPHSAWELLEHIRIALDDIARFSGVYHSMADQPTGTRPPDSYTELKWPDQYWPPSPEPPSVDHWHQSVAAVNEGMAAFLAHLQNPAHDLFAPFPWGDGQTLLREALLIADHNAYHTGQLLLIRRMLESSG